jgi:hypothetical protein
MPTAFPTDHATVVQAIVARLRVALALNESQCYFSMDSWDSAPKLPAGGNFIVRVHVQGGPFPADLLVGGGMFGAVERATTFIAWYTRVKLDRGDHAHAAAFDPARGIFAVKGQILQAMLQSDLLDDEGNALTIDMMGPLRSFGPKQLTAKDDAIYVSGLSFSTDFAWNINPLPTPS